MYSVFGCSSARRWISEARASYMTGPAFWVIWRCGAIPATVGRGPERAAILAEDRKPVFG